MRAMVKAVLLSVKRYGFNHAEAILRAEDSAKTGRAVFSHAASGQDVRGGSGFGQRAGYGQGKCHGHFHEDRRGGGGHRWEQEFFRAVHRGCDVVTQGFVDSLEIVFYFRERIT